MVLKVQNEKAGFGSFYLTEGIRAAPEDQCQYFYPEHLIEKLNATEETNLIEIQTNYDAKEELDKLTKELSALREKNSHSDEDYDQRKRAFEAAKEAALRRGATLRDMRRGSVNSIYVVSEGQELDMARIGEAIADMHRDILAKQQSNFQSSGEVKLLLKELEGRIIADFKDVSREDRSKKKGGKEYRLKQEGSEDKKREGKATKERKEVEVHRGRKDMTKNFLKKATERHKQTLEKKEDNNEKYFNEGSDF
jgi:hypothetical protein